MKRFFLSLAVVNVLALGGSQRTLAIGGEVGNGGDSVECIQSGASPFSGFYSLDYLLTYRHDNDNRDVVNVNSWEESRQRLLSLFAAKAPDLGRLFSKFVAELDNHSDYLRPYIWQEAAYGLIPFDDQRMVRRLPTNCQQVDSGQVNVIQSVMRRKRPGTIVFQYDPTIYSELSRHYPLQLSFLLVHEWLWDLTSDVEVVREADRFLHSSNADILSAADFEQSLTNMGIDLRQTAFKPVCERSAAVQSALEIWERQPCVAITEFTRKWDPLDLSSQAVHEIKLGDFSGLGSVLYSINLSHNILEFLYRDTFAGLYALQGLRLSDNRLTSLQSGVFDEVIGLTSLSLDHNQLTELPRDLFARNSRIQFIDLSFNQIAHIDPQTYGEAFSNPVSESTDGSFGLNLSHNVLTDLRAGDLNSLVGVAKLFLSDNQLTTIEAGAFSGLTFVREIDLSNNRLTTLPEGIFNGLSRLRNIDLRGNQFSEAEVSRIRASLLPGVTLQI